MAKHQVKLLLTISAIFAATAYRIEAQQAGGACVKGCSQEWTGRNWTTGCQLFTDKLCFDSGVYDTKDFGGPCITFGGGRIDIYSCPDRFCKGVCTNCPAGAVCNQSGTINYNECTYVSTSASRRCASAG